MDDNQMKKLYPEYSKFRFFEPDTKLRWMAEYAEAFAYQIAYKRNENLTKILDKKNKPIPGLTTTRLRNFYNEFLRIAEIKDGEQKLVMIMLLKAKVNYKKHQAGGSSIPADFVGFIEALVNQIKPENLDQNFQHACYIMQAIVAYIPNSELQGD